MKVHRYMLYEFLNYPRNFWIYGYQSIDAIASMFIVDFVWRSCLCQSKDQFKYLYWIPTNRYFLYLQTINAMFAHQISLFNQKIILLQNRIILQSGWANFSNSTISIIFAIWKRRYHDVETVVICVHLIFDYIINCYYYYYYYLNCFSLLKLFSQDMIWSYISVNDRNVNQKEF